ncbi:MAG: MarR family winged helix-turn-helix transcriptional regulator [Janthinobacterium lividum]
MAFYTESTFEPDCSIGYLVRRAHQLGGAALEPVFEDEGLSSLQWSALVSIWFKRGETAADLARFLGHDKGAMTRLVDTLEQRGWITRVRTSCDRRRIDLVLTPEGRDVTLRCRARVVVCWNEWLADWPRDEVQTLIDLLSKLRDTLDRADGPCS